MHAVRLQDPRHPLQTCTSSQNSSAESVLASWDIGIWLILPDKGVYGWYDTFTWRLQALPCYSLIWQACDDNLVAASAASANGDLQPNPGIHRSSLLPHHHLSILLTGSNTGKEANSAQWVKIEYVYLPVCLLLGSGQDLAACF